jgi:REP element-mobilizing transposase RayT
MARQPQLHYPGALYHVMSRGNGGQDVFFDPDDRYYLYLLLQEGIARYGHRIHAFCRMRNHLHPAVQVADISLSRVMQNLAFRYTRWVNRRQGKRGHLFQDRYQALLVDQDAYLLELTRYIHLNPVRAGLVRDLTAYRWSGHRAYLGKATLPWLTTDLVLSQFSAHRGHARRRYQRFVAEGKRQGHREEFHTGSLAGRVLGDDKFAERALKRAGQHRGAKVDLDTLIKRVCQDYKLSETDLSAAGKHRRAAEARAVVAWVVREAPQLTLAALSDRVRCDATKLSASVPRLLGRSQDDKVLARRPARVRRQVLK